jgi:MFS transporter, DHA2 family, multidrug resistance protein
VSEAVGAYLFLLITRWPGALHSGRIVDQIGQNRFRTVQANGVLPTVPTPLLPNGHPRAPGALQAFAAAVQEQVTIMTAADTFLILAALTVLLMIIVVLPPVRTLPPRLLLAKR